jgi:hypothetical protein
MFRSEHADKRSLLLAAPVPGVQVSTHDAMYLAWGTCQ